MNNRKTVIEFKVRCFTFNSGDTIQLLIGNEVVVEKSGVQEELYDKIFSTVKSLIGKGKTTNKSTNNTTKLVKKSTKKKVQPKKKSKESDDLFGDLDDLDDKEFDL